MAGDVYVPLTELEEEAELAREEFVARFRGNTLAAYLGDLDAWFDWCAEQPVPVLDIKRVHFARYDRWMEVTKGYAPSTRDRRISTVCSFYRNALADERITADPTRYIHRPKVPKESQTLGLSYDEFVCFLKAARALGPIDHAVACLLGLLGLRCTEALSVNVEDLSEERGHRVLRVVGKGAKRVLIPLPAPVAEIIDLAVAGRPAGPLLRTRTGARMTRSAVCRTVARICRKAGISKRISPHSLRHTYVTQLLDAGAALREVQIAARHADPRQTMRYDRAREQLDRHANYVLAARMAGDI
jgi:integrase/recombinase XerD